MEIISEKEISTKQATHFLKKITKDSYIEENDPDLAKDLALVLAELTAHQEDIVVPENAEEEEKPEEEKLVKEEEKEKPEEEMKEEEKPQVEEKRKKHRKHRTHEQQK